MDEEQEDRQFYETLADVKRLRREIGEDSTDSTSEISDEDSEAALITKESAEQFAKTIHAIRERDELVYDSQARLFDNAVIEAAAEALDSAERHQTYTFIDQQKDDAKRDVDSIGEEHEEPRIRPNAVRLSESRSALTAMLESDSGDDFLAPREEILEPAPDPFSGVQELDETDKFLRDYIVNQRWRDTGARGDTTVPTAMPVLPGTEPSGAADTLTVVADHDHRVEQRRKLFGGDFGDDVSVSGSDQSVAEDFEWNYNHQLERPATGPSARVATVGKRGKRRAARQERLHRLEQEKLRLENEVRKLQNQRRSHLVDKLNAIAAIGGLSVQRALANTDHDLADDPLLGQLAAEIDAGALSKDGKRRRLSRREQRQLKRQQAADNESDPDAEENRSSGSEWDPERYDRAMDAAFGDEYYGAEDNTVEQEIEATAGSARPHRADPTERERAERELRQAVSEYYEVTADDPVTKGEPRFDYIEVQPESFGLTAEDIFSMTDDELNQRISLKAYNPYRDSRWRPRTRPKTRSQRGKTGGLRDISSERASAYGKL